MLLFFFAIVTAVIMERMVFCMKKLAHYFIAGASIFLGTEFAKWILSVTKDPVKRKNVKRKIKNVFDDEEN